ncbi:MAG: chemotaxis protein CheD [Ginsengibacter sp.]
MQKPGLQIDKHYLYPGKLFSSKKPHLVDTILGSCVAVFLWDPLLQFGSINHFMLPFGDKELSSFKYGNIATPELIARMLHMGSEKKNLKAKLFGGSNISHSNGIFNIGKRNIVLAREVLNKEHIPIISYSIGGFLGRKVIFNTANGVVLISYTRGDINLIDQQNNSQNFNLHEHE